MTRKPPPDEEAPLTVKQAAARLGLHVQSVYDLIHDKKIGHLAYPMAGGKVSYRIEPAEIARYKKASRVAATT